MENNNNSINDEELDNALEKQYGIDAINSEYADDASYEDNRTSFEKEKDEEINSKVVESSYHGKTTVIKTTEEINTNDTTINKESKKKVNPLVISTLILGILSVLICITFAVIQAVIVVGKQGKIDTSLYDLFTTIKYIAWVILGSSIIIDIISFIVTTKQKLVKIAIFLTVFGFLIIILTEFVLSTIK